MTTDYPHLPLRFVCTVNSEGYRFIEGGFLVEVNPEAKYIEKIFTAETLEEWNYTITALREEGRTKSNEDYYGLSNISDKAPIDKKLLFAEAHSDIARQIILLKFTNKWGHLLYDDNERLPNEPERFGDKAGQKLDKEKIFNHAPYEAVVSAIATQSEGKHSIFNPRGIVVDHFTDTDGIYKPCVVPNNLSMALHLFGRVSPSKKFVTCKYFKKNGNKSRTHRGVDEHGNPKQCPIGCRIYNPDGRVKWGEGCRQAWFNKQMRERKAKAKLIHNDDTREQTQTQKKGTE